MPTETPIFVVFGDFEWAPKKGAIFPKQIVATKMRLFCTFRTQIVLAYFSKRCHFDNKKPFLFTTTQKTLFFWVSFWKFPFPCVSSFLFWFIQHEKDKSPKNIFFRKPFFDTLTNCQKNIFAPLHRICVFLKTPPKHYKIGENKPNKSWTDFQLNLGQIFSSTLDRFSAQRQILDRFSALHHIYVYIYIYICICWLWSQVLDQF